MRVSVPVAMVRMAKMAVAMLMCRFRRIARLDTPVLRI